MPTLVGFPSPAVYVQQGVSVCINTIVNRQFGVQTLPQQNITIEGAELMSDVLLDQFNNCGAFFKDCIISVETYIKNLKDPKKS